MKKIDVSPIFRSGFSKPVELKPDVLQNYKDSFDELLSKLKLEHRSDPEISADRIIASTTVEQKGNHKLVMENCGNIQDILHSCVNQLAKLDDRTLARLDVLLDAAVNNTLTVVYKEKECGSQKLTIMTHHGLESRPELRQLQTLFGESSSLTTVEFSDQYKDRMVNLKRTMPNRIYETLNSTQKRKEVEVRLDGLKDNPKGSLAEEILPDQTKKAQDSIEETRQEQKGEAQFHKVEREFEEQAIIERQIQERRDRENGSN